MKLSTKGRYGARAMLELAFNYGKRPVLLREISEEKMIKMQRKKWLKQKNIEILLK